MISAHKEIPDLDLRQLFERCRKIAIFVGGESTGPWIASSFRTSHMKPLAVVCQNLTLSDERLATMEVSELESHQFDSSSIIILLDRELQ